jgi:polysaccharide chain length determinant protein (PEP-CTERM system associated)
MEELSNQVLAALKGIWKYRWWATIVAWLVFITGTVVVFVMPDKYQASARVYVDTQSVLKPLMSSMTSLPNMEQQVSIMSRTLLSRPNIERLIRMVDLDIKTKDGKDMEKLVFDLTNDIKLSGTAREDIYTISYSHHNPKLAKDVVQALLTIFVEGSFGDKKLDSQKAVAFIDEQIKTYEQKLLSAENALKEFKIRNADVLPRDGASYAAKLGEVADQLDRARLELREAEQTRNALRRQLSGEDAALLVDQNAITSTDSEVDGRLQGLYKNLDSLQMQFTDRHPDILSTKRLIEQLEARKEEELKKRREKPQGRANYSPALQQISASLAEAEAAVAGLSARVSEYQARHGRLKGMMNAVPEVESQLAQLNRDYAVNKDNYEKLIGRREAAKLSEELTSTGMVKFKIIDPPIVPQQATGPNRPRLLSFVLAAALGAGLGCGFLMSQARPTYSSQLSLKNATNLPLLGTVSLNWTPTQRMHERRSVIMLTAVFLLLAMAYGGVMLRVSL